MSKHESQDGKYFTRSSQPIDMATFGEYNPTVVTHDSLC